MILRHSPLMSIKTFFTITPLIALLSLVTLSLVTPSVMANNDKPLRILALGDSYTIGQSVPVQQRWPNQLADLLQSQGLPVASPKIIARTGWTTKNLNKAINQSKVSPPYDIVTLLIGVNDQFQGRSTNSYKTGFKQLLEKAIFFAGHPQHVIVLSIPDYSVTPFGKSFDPENDSRELVLFNQINRDISNASGVHYVDITPISLEAKNDSTLLARDELHPSGKMYELWAKKTLPIILSLFSEQKRK